MNNRFSTLGPSDPEEGYSFKTSQRRKVILKLLHQQRLVRVSSLAQKFCVSEVTVRTDLDALEKEGLLIREHGGAIPATGGRRLITANSDVEERGGWNIEEKQRIAKAAAQSVQPHDVIMLDAGTTVIEMIPWLRDIPDLTIITPGLNVAVATEAAFDGKLIILGGSFCRMSFCNVGSLVLQALGGIKVTKLFLGIRAFDIKDGLTETSFKITQVKRAMIAASREVILLADSSKWEASAFIKVAPFSCIHRLITDSQLPATAREALTHAEIKYDIV